VAAPSLVVTPAEPLCVISPHLDDAALSCGRLLAALPGSVVFTVFGGAPPDPSTPTHEWDLETTSSAAAGAAVSIRQAEDVLAAERLGCRVAWSAWSEYHAPEPSVRQLADAIAAALEEIEPASVAMPLGIYHQHHVAVSEGALEVLASGATGGSTEWFVYTETPYAQHYPALTVERLTRMASAVSLEAVALPQAPAERRVEAVDAYATQLPLLRALLPHVDRDLHGVEPYWRATLLNS
jgi:LmbE family N-acetylglucosaminyl deacetylase